MVELRVESPGVCGLPMLGLYNLGTDIPAHGRVHGYRTRCQYTTVPGTCKTVVLDIASESSDKSESVRIGYQIGNYSIPTSDKHVFFSGWEGMSLYCPPPPPAF